ncbi:MAG: TonB-dependent receptor plug domain-containing protein [Saprospiraceae bacterium]|nr:TonB-dependent receptor plug domain-containing protein [Candidatus Vicinibacter affinis]
MLKYIGIFLGLFFSNLIFSQEEIQDSINGKVLNEITIKGYRPIADIKQLGSIHQTYIIAGKKNEVVLVKDMAANLAEKTGRQIFAKIPGAFIYDMDGSGNQVNISTRGLDPHRSWEYNIRQNGIMINSDLYGYPASHYSMPMEAIEKIELVHGTSSLQYGAEFGV